MNSWSGTWGKKGFAWIPSEMLDWAEIAFATEKQTNSFIELLSSGDIKLDTIKFKNKKFR